MSSTISHLSPSGTPLYQQVKRALLGTLASGEWSQGEAIPPEKSLAQRFGVSIGTLRKAIDELVLENILTRHQGRGTFVAIHAHNQHFFRYFRIVRQDGVKTYPTQQLLGFRRIRANGETREKLLLGPGAYVFEFVNLLTLHDEEVMVDTICVPEALFSGLSNDQLASRPGTLYSMYQQDFGINVIGTAEKVRTCTANAEDAGRLKLPQGTALLEIRRVAFSYNQQPVEWRVSRVNTERYEYVGQEHQSS